MSDKPLPFVVTDRRKFNAEGQPRPDADPSPEHIRPEAALPPLPAAVVEMPRPAEPEAAEPVDISELETDEDASIQAPTAEQMEQSRLAFQATAERLDLAVRAANPGGDHPPALTLESLIQSVYMQTVLQLGGSTEQGQQPQVDILGARQSIDMLGLLYDKTAENLTEKESLLLSSALFEVRLAFLEMTQALARSAQQRNPAAPGQPGQSGPTPISRPGPSIVR